MAKRDALRKYQSESYYLAVLRYFLAKDAKDRQVVTSWLSSTPMHLLGNKSDVSTT